MNGDADSDQPNYGKGRNARPEPSTFMRFFEILAGKVSGRFSLDITRSVILLSSQWIAEGPNQQNMHDRYSTSTHLIMAAIYPIIRSMDDGEKKKEAMDEYESIEKIMNSCDIVEVAVVGGVNVKDTNEFRLVTKVSESDEDGSCKTTLHELKSTVVCKQSNYNDGVMAASENGYRRVNCAARRMYYRALKLAFSIGYLNAEKPLEVEGEGVSQKQTDDFLSKSKKQLGA